MTTLGDVRTELRDELAATGLKVWSALPGQISPPLVVLGAGDPYVEIPDGQTFGSLVVRVNLVASLLTGKPDSQAASSAIDQMIDKVLPVCADLGWSFSVDAPYMYTADDKKYLACDISVSNTFELED